MFMLAMAGTTVFFVIVPIKRAVLDEMVIIATFETSTAFNCIDITLC